MQIRYFKSELSNTSEYYGEGYMTVDKVISFSKVYILIKIQKQPNGNIIIPVPLHYNDCYFGQLIVTLNLANMPTVYIINIQTKQKLSGFLLKYGTSIKTPVIMPSVEKKVLYLYITVWYFMF